MSQVDREPCLGSLLESLRSVSLTVYVRHKRDHSYYDRLPFTILVQEIMYTLSRIVTSNSLSLISDKQTCLPQTISAPVLKIHRELKVEYLISHMFVQAS